MICDNVIHRLAKTWFFLSPLFFCRNTAKIAKGCNSCHHFQNAAQGSKAHRPRGAAPARAAHRARSGARSTHPAKSCPPERTRCGHRLPGKGLPWAGAALRAAAFEGESASWPCWASAGSYFIGSKTPARPRAGTSTGSTATARAQAGQVLATSQGAAHRARSGARSTHPAKSCPPERTRCGHRLPGKGLP